MCMYVSRTCMEGYTQELLTGVNFWQEEFCEGNRRRGKELFIFIYSPLFYLVFLQWACITFIINKLDVKNKVHPYWGVIFFF